MLEPFCPTSDGRKRSWDIRPLSRLCSAGSATLCSFYVGMYEDLITGAQVFFRQDRVRNRCRSRYRISLPFMGTVRVPQHGNSLVFSEILMTRMLVYFHYGKRISIMEGGLFPIREEVFWKISKHHFIFGTSTTTKTGNAGSTPSVSAGMDSPEC